MNEADIQLRLQKAREDAIMKGVLVGAIAGVAIGFVVTYRYFTYNKPSAALLEWAKS